MPAARYESIIDREDGVDPFNPMYKVNQVATPERHTPLVGKIKRLGQFSSSLCVAASEATKALIHSRLEDDGSLPTID